MSKLISQRKWQMPWYAVGVLAILLLSSVQLWSQTKVIMPSVFENYMVLQREVSVPVWGWAVPGETVTVAFRGQTKAVVASPGSVWRVYLDAMPADASPHMMTISCAGQTITISDVLVGDVWLGIGQSNMTITLNQTGTQGAYVTPSVQDEIRAQAPYSNLRLKRSDVGTVNYGNYSHWRIASATALNDFPCILSMFGINIQKEINIPIGLIVSSEGATPAGYYIDYRSVKNSANYSILSSSQKAIVDAGAIYDQQYDDWLNASNLARINGTAIPAEPARPSGYEGRGYMSYIRPYAGIAVKGILWDQGEGGGGFGLNTTKMIETVALGYRNIFTYNGILPFIYIQKRSGSGCAYNDPNDFENEYKPQPSGLIGYIGGWIGDQINFVQLHQPDKQIYMVTAYDLNKDIHPTQKEQYTRRAADVALKEVYGYNQLRTMGPIYKGYQLEGNKVIIHFNYADAGLTARHSPTLQGFGIGGDMWYNYWATAQVVGNKVVLSHPNITTASSAWYALADGETQWGNVFNLDKFPMYPFQTDDASKRIPSGTPVAVASADKLFGEKPLTVIFSGLQSWDPNGTIVSYNWNFGDGATSTGATPTHTYTTDGVFKVTLSVTDNTGVIGTDVIHIGVGKGLLPPDTEAPSVPSELTATAISYTGFTLNWHASTDNIGVVSYDVFRNGILTGTVTTTNFTITNLACGSTNAMTVKAKDAAGNTSDANPVFEVYTTACDNVAPSVPTNLTVSNITANAAQLSWNASTDNVGVTGYEVFNGNARIASTTGNSCSLTNLFSSTAYNIRVKALDGSGNVSDASSAVNFSTLASATDITVLRTLDAIVADGNITESVWAANTPITKTITGTTNNNATFGVLYDATYLYVAIRVTDAANFNDSPNAWDDDAIEIFIDGDHNRGTVYDAYDRQIIKVYGSPANTVWESNGTSSGTSSGWKSVAGGYTMEFAIPWSAINVVPTSGKSVGFDVAIDDDDNGAGRDSQLTWAGNGDNWGNTSAFGSLILGSQTTGEGSVDTIAPSVPANLVATLVSTIGFTLNWDASTDNIGVTSYDVYANGQLKGTSASTQFVFSDLLPSTNYSVTVCARDASGNISGLASPINVTTSNNGNGNDGSFTFKPIRVGGGGWVTGLVINPAKDSIVYCRTDVGGVYKFDFDNQKWVQLVTSQRMPANWLNAAELNGEGLGVRRQAAYQVASIATDPSNPNVFMFVAANSLFKSNDGGNSFVWMQNFNVVAEGNKNERSFGERLQIDPNNSSNILYGSQTSGMWKSNDGGYSWSSVPASQIPVETTGGVTWVQYDKNNVNRVYAGVKANGVYRSNDGGDSWTKIFSTTNTSDGQVVNGLLWFTCNNGIYKYNGTALTQTSTLNMADIAVNPSDNQTVYAISDGFSNWGNGLVRTINGGSSWTSLTKNVTSAIGWKAIADFMQPNGWLSIGDITIDPRNPNRMWFSEGMGVFSASIANTINDPLFVDISDGIEELVASDIASLPGGKIITSCWDRVGMYITNPDEFPVKEAGPNTFDFSGGSSVATCPTNSAFAIITSSDFPRCGNCNTNVLSGYTSDAGTSWNKFGSVNSTWQNYPADLVSGEAVVSAGNTANLVWAPRNGSNQNIYYSSNSGSSWSLASISNYESANASFLTAKKVLTADATVSGKFYLYSWNTGRIHESVNGGASWSQKSGQLPYYCWHPQLKYAPGNSGHIWFATGYDYRDGSNGLYFSENSGDSLTQIPDVQECWAFGFGKESPGASYPTIFMYGRINNKWGLYMSTDKAATWVLATEYPLGLFDQVTVIEGDIETFGKVYLGFSGNGYAYGTYIPGSSVPVTGIGVSPANVSLYPGGTRQLIADVIPLNATNKAVSWISSNTNVVTVNQAGLVTAIGTGSATITATTVDGSYSAVSSVQVVPTPNWDCIVANGSFESDLQNWTINSGSVTISGNAAIGVKSALLTGPVGMEQTVNVPVPEGTQVILKFHAYIGTGVAWAGAGIDFKRADGTDISKPMVQITSTGWQEQVLTANAPAGTEKVNVWAYTTNGELYVDNYCIQGISVNIPVTSVSLNTNVANLLVSNALQLIATIEPQDATNQKVVFTSSNEQVATVDSLGFVTAISAGTTIVTATTIDGAKTASCQVTVAVPAALTCGVINNTSFESELTNWDTWGTLQNIVGDAHTGFKAMSLAPNTGFQYYQHIPVSTGQVVNASAWAKVTGGQYAAMQLQFRDASYANIGNQTNLMFNQESYSQQLVSGLQVPAGATQLFLTFWNGGNSTFIIDDICVEVLTPFIPIVSVELQPASLNLSIGSGFQLSTIVNPSNATNKTVTYSSSNTAVVAVNQVGFVTAVSPGTALITVTTEDGGFTSQSSVTVVQPVTGITLTPESSTLNAGATLQMISTIIPVNASNTSVIYQSDNPAVATINAAGIVTGVSEGMATITATTVDGGFSDSATISVQALASGTGLTASYFNNKTLTGAPVFTTVQAVNFNWGTGKPSTSVNADNFSVRWEGYVEAPVNGNITFSTVSDDGVRLWVNGNQIINNWTNHSSVTNTASPMNMVSGTRYPIKMEYYENTGQAVARLRWSYAGQSAISIPQAYLYPVLDKQIVVSDMLPIENAKDLTVLVWPNPVTGNAFTVELSGIDKEVEIRVSRLTGQLVYASKFTPNVNNPSEVIDCSSLENGLYVLTISNEAIHETIKLIIK